MAFAVSSISWLYAARGLRGFGDGFAIHHPAAYMMALGYDPVAIGIVATASLLGTALFLSGAVWRQTYGEEFAASMCCDMKVRWPRAAVPSA